MKRLSVLVIALSVIGFVGVAKAVDEAEVIRSLEESCGEKYEGSRNPNEHSRFYCMQAFGNHCNLKLLENSEEYLRRYPEVTAQQLENARNQLKYQKTVICAPVKDLGVSCPYCR